MTKDFTLDALGQCQKCKATITYDFVDFKRGTPLVHNEPLCGGTVKLFQSMEGYFGERSTSRSV